MITPSVRIALVYAHFNYTGSLPRQQVQLARYLVRAGHEVHAYSFAATREQDLAPGVHFHDVPATRTSDSRLGLAMHAATFARNATRMIARDRAAYDVIHGRGMSTWEQDILHLTGVVSGEVRRDRLTRDSSGLMRRLKDALLPVAAPIVSVRKIMERRIFEDRVPLEIHTSSRLVRDDLLAAYDVDRARIRVVPPGVDLDEFRPPADRLAARRDLELTDPDTLILFCGDSFKRKGLDRAVLALEKMREPARLVVVGGDDPEPYLRLATQLGVEDRVHIIGPRTDTWRFFQAADIFVLPTRVDMWGMTVAEAMATGVPPITTTGAGAADVIANGENGFVLPEPLEVDLLAGTLDRLAADPKLRHRIGRAAQKRARTLTWDQHGQEVEAAMRHIAESGRRRAPSSTAGSSLSAPPG
jgi:glycosyltransferase involved in cell wall biosynthesis